MPGTIGDTTKTLFLVGPEAHKLHLEFEVNTGATIEKGQLVILATNGKIAPAGTAAAEHTVIGVALHSGTAGELVTVATRGYSVIFAEAKSALNAGPVETYTGAGTNYPQRVNAAASTTYYVAATSGGAVTTAFTPNPVDMIGWSLDVAGDAGDVVRVLLKD